MEGDMEDSTRELDDYFIELISRRNDSVMCGQHRPLRRMFGHAPRYPPTTAHSTLSTKNGQAFLKMMYV